ncbi:MAG TPA: UDP-3-O-(3-hydroxymyristoyl)glucosamine N-acyltransferase [Thermodesulfovibrionales bacterium]|nr:UDP-3-O-(3-hydroxymyristoyl)glucosamine N-acyltransferase [Thermodesulfovibrionales bacterium]
MKLSEVTTMLGGELSGNPDGEIHGASGIGEVQEGEITFLADRKLLQECAGSKASCVLVKEFFTELRKPQIRVKNPQYAFAQLLKHFSVSAAIPSGISHLAFVSGNASIGNDVSIHPFSHISDGAVIGEKTVIYPGVFIGNDASIGRECVIYPNVTVRERVRIGNAVIIHSGSVIGSDGFGYVFEEGRHFKILQVGTVVIGDDVEIGANVTIDRATTGLTVIGRGTKIDNLVQIGHNVNIGENSILVAQVGIAGSAEIGNFVILGGQVGVADHAKIDDGSMIGAQSGIMGGHLTKGVYSGSPVMPHREWLRAKALFARLPELNKRIRELEEKLNHLEGRQKC